MAGIPKIALDLFNYDLPNEKIAHFPIEPRDHSKLLVFHEGQISDRYFYELDQVVDPCTIITNNTKVIPARIWFQNERGQNIQIFILKPISADWSICEVMVGNRKKFKENDVLRLSQGDLFLEVVWENRELNWVKLNSNASSVIEAIEVFGQVPLPPYIEREVQHEDKNTYQAIFAQKEGAVAAPTASLHFTPELKLKLELKNCEFRDVTLHVSAGTFKPVTAEFADEHEMHAERFEISLELIDHLLNSPNGVLAVGTTATRVLESLYYLGEKAFLGELDDCFIASGDAYSEKYGKLETRMSLEYLRKYVAENGGILKGETQIFIVPGFNFRVVQWMITNFHQPKSTLLLLISAFVGEGWREIYDHAMGGGYRFLSYGDGSLLKGKKNITI